MTTVDVSPPTAHPSTATRAACPLCGSSRLHYLFSVAKSRVERCQDCQLMLHDLRTFEVDPSFEAKPNQSITTRTPALVGQAYNLLERYRGKTAGRLLAVVGGSSRVAFAEEGTRRGLQINVVEPVANAPLERPSSGAGYDVVALYNVLDAVPDPGHLLQQARALLVPGGTLLVATFSFDVRSAQQLRHRSGEFHPEQYFYFARATLETLLIRNGFAEIITRTGLGNPTGGSTGGMVFMARAHEQRVPQKLSLVVPAFNEVQTFETNFEKLLAKQIEGLDIEIVVVESNSTDGTRDIVARYQGHPRVTVVWEDRPRGKGHAVRSGLERVTGDYVLIQDADLEYDLEDYEALLEPLVQGHTAFVLGARHGGSAWKMRSFTGQPVISAVLNGAHWFFTLLVNVGFGARLKDPFTMYKVFRRDCLYGLEFVCNRFDFDFELVIKLLRKGYYPLEIPVNYRSRSFAEGKKVSFFSDPLTWLRALLRFRFEPMDPLENIVRQRQSGVKTASPTIPG